MSSFTFGFNVKPRKAGGVSYDADAQAFFTAASITNTTQKNAVNQLVLDLKSYGVWTKCSAIYPICGGSASSHAVNLKTPGTYNLTFSTGWTHSSTGMTPNGTSAYADTFFVPSSNLTLFNGHLSFYNRTSSFSGTASKVLIGVSSNSGIYNAKENFWLNQYAPLNAMGAEQHSEAVSTDYAAKTGLANRLGFWINSRTSSTATTLKLFRNGISEANATTSSAGQALNIYQIYIGALRTQTVAAPYAFFYDNSQCSFTSIGTGLTDTEAANFYTAVQAYQTTLSRNV